MALLPFLLFMTSSAEITERNNDPDPQRELESFRVAEGMEVTLFASEPMVTKPIQMNWDADGRLWVVSSTAYPNLKTGEEANDKIYVLEDTDNDGKADKSTIFAEGLLTPTGILPGDGGVYVANSTEILFLKDTDGDGKADFKKRILNGFGVADVHHLIHTFRWGPEGLLYFNQSIYTYSHVETPFGVIRLEGGGVWQLDPKTLKLDIYARGLINPWGLRFDDWGQSFLTDGAGGQGINYAFPGATFVTAPGAERTIRGLNPGQPKHSGLEIVSSRHLPDSWQGTLLANDFRANRINRFVLEEQGSGYASRQVDDVMWTDDVAFRPVDINVGPDGAIYVADWYNPIIQHGEVDFNDPRRDQKHGRIWRITAKKRPLLQKVALSKAPVTALLDALKSPEELTRANARQVLKERGPKLVLPALEKWVADLDKNDHSYAQRKLEALWVYQALKTVNEPLLLELLNSQNHHARAAALRALGFWYDNIKNTAELLSKASKDVHPQVRLEAVIALGKLNTVDAAKTALAVLDFQMDEFLDFALWQTMQELAPVWTKRITAEPGFFGDTKKTVFALKSVNSASAVAQLMSLYQKNEIPEPYESDVLNSIARNGTGRDLDLLLEIATKKSGTSTGQQLAALEDAYTRRKEKPTNDLVRIMPFTTSGDPKVAQSAIRLAGYWKLENQLDAILKLTNSGDVGVQKAALFSAALMNPQKAQSQFSEILDGKYPDALKLLVAGQMTSIHVTAAADRTVKLLNELPANVDISEVLQAFFRTKGGIAALGQAIATTKIPQPMAMFARKEVQQKVRGNRQTDEDVVQLKKALEQSGGSLPVERMPQELSDSEIAKIAGEAKTTADPVKGELLFRQTNCYTCHALGGAGGLIGPDLSSLGTSSPAETIIKSILYPAVSIKEGYELQRIVKTDGSELMGYLVSSGNTEIVMRDVTGMEQNVAKNQISKIEKIPGSLMPPGLTASLDKQEFIDLIGFLSRLGESGKYRVPNTRYVRRWEGITNGEKNATGLDNLIMHTATQTGIPIYSTVSGGIPLSELSAIKVGKDKLYSLVRFDVEVLSKGIVQIELNTGRGVLAWIGTKSQKIAGQGISAELPIGKHQITLVIDRGTVEASEITAQLNDKSTAQTRLVMGR
ncbi:putative membrane-bound dehydrogenase-like protein [Dyadobacter jejuensis]|uniref:Putative membrane-bound dehydrogenase-like protein n=2 Tax=Dyadobacter jejuensis TaxID=1082580 RepID=A0A316B6F8_9BACT|nr:putative membrane-bound dehydrogenase-like protein [Dyadobacter jejuensis]